MTVRSTRQLLNAIAAACAVAAAGVVIWALQPATAAEPSPLKLRTVNESSQHEQQAEVPANELLAAASIPIRRPLIDPKPQPQKTRPRQARTPVARKVTPQFKLVATVIEAGRNVAIISDARGRTDLKGVGGKLQLLPSGASVREIQPDRVTIEFQGRRIPLQLAGGPRGGYIPPRGAGMNNANGERPEAPAVIRDR